MKVSGSNERNIGAFTESNFFTYKLKQMTITTAYNIGDLIQNKFARSAIHDAAAAALIVEIKTITCYTTAQVFYVCRPIHLLYKTDWEALKEGDKTKPKQVVDVVFGHMKERDYLQFREDEVKPCDPAIEAEIRKFQLDPQ